MIIVPEMQPDQAYFGIGFEKKKMKTIF